MAQSVKTLKTNNLNELVTSVVRVFTSIIFEILVQEIKRKLDMTPHKPEKRKLSKSILEMKFMKKSKEKAERDEEEEKGRAAFASELTEAMRIGSSKFVIEPSFVPCEDLIVGRLSYHGMNPEIEKLLELEKATKMAKLVKEEADVSDAEMAKHYSSLINTMANKFKSKAERNEDCKPPLRKRAKFMKPEE